MRGRTPQKGRRNSHVRKGLVSSSSATQVTPSWEALGAQWVVPQMRLSWVFVCTLSSPPATLVSWKGPKHRGSTVGQQPPGCCWPQGRSLAMCPRAGVLGSFGTGWTSAPTSGGAALGVLSPGELPGCLLWEGLVLSATPSCLQRDRSPRTGLWSILPKGQSNRIVVRVGRRDQGWCDSP